MDKKKVILSVFFLIFVAHFLFGEDVFKFSGDRLTTRMAKGQEYTVLLGNAKIIFDSMIITAETIELFGDDYRFAECSGLVKVEDGEQGLFIQAEKMVFDRIEEISLLEGAVVMEDLKNEVVVKGNYLEYNSIKEIATIQVGVRILREDMACRSEFARYDREAELLELSGLPIVIWKDDSYKALKIIVNMKTDEIFLEGTVSGVIQTEADEEEETDVADAEIGTTGAEEVQGVAEQSVEEDEIDGE